MIRQPGNSFLVMQPKGLDNVLQPANFVANTPLTPPQQNQLPTPITEVYSPGQTVDRRQQLAADVARAQDQAAHEQRMQPIIKAEQDTARMQRENAAVDQALNNPPRRGSINWRDVPPMLRQSPSIKANLDYSGIRQGIADRKQAADDAAYQEYLRQHPVTMSQEEAQRRLNDNTTPLPITNQPGQRQYVNTGPDGLPLQPGQNIDETTADFEARRQSIEEAQQVSPAQRGRAFREAMIRRGVEKQLQADRANEMMMENARNQTTIAAAAARAGGNKSKEPKPIIIKDANGGSITVDPKDTFQGVPWQDMSPAAQQRVWSKWDDMAQRQGGRTAKNELINQGMDEALRRLGLDPAGMTDPLGKIIPWTASEGEQRLRSTVVGQGLNAFDYVQQAGQDAWRQHVASLAQSYGQWDPQQMIGGTAGGQTMQQAPAAGQAAGQPAAAAPAAASAAPLSGAGGNPMAELEQQATAMGGWPATLAYYQQKKPGITPQQIASMIAAEYGVTEADVLNKLLGQ